MRRFLALLLATLIPLTLQVNSSFASLPGVIDYSNPRIVPILSRVGSTEVQFSGFLYSPRIVFTAAHSPLNIGNAVGLPNSNTNISGKTVRVVKKLISPKFNPRMLTGDFAIFILAEDLAAVEPSPLMTPEIESVLMASRAKIKQHGYGRYQDRNLCVSRDCAQVSMMLSNEPRMFEFTAHPMEDFANLVGYTRKEIASHFTLYSGPLKGSCGGDSGGSLTADYEARTYYVGPTPNGMNVYACGQASDYDGTGGIWYSSQVYNHLDLIKEAEEFVAKAVQAENLAKASTTVKPKSIKCVKGKLIKKVSGENPKCPKGYRKD